MIIYHCLSLLVWSVCHQEQLMKFFNVKVHWIILFKPTIAFRFNYDTINTIKYMGMMTE